VDIASRWRRAVAFLIGLRQQWRRGGLRKTRKSTTPPTAFGRSIKERCISNFLTVRILIYGSGVHGSVYGGVLAQSGHDVTFLARGLRAAQLRAGGLVLRGALGDRDMNFHDPS